jgi:hypothetical protein
MLISKRQLDLRLRGDPRPQHSRASNIQGSADSGHGAAFRKNKKVEKFVIFFGFELAVSQDDFIGH